MLKDTRENKSVLLVIILNDMNQLIGPPKDVGNLIHTWGH